MDLRKCDPLLDRLYEVYAPHVSRPAPKPAPKKASIRYPREHSVGRPPTTWQGIIRQVSREMNITVEAIIGGRRFRKVVAARQEAAWRLRKHGLSYPQVAHRLGMKDHTTAMHAVEKVDRQRRQTS